MLSIDYIRNNKQKVIDAAKNKNREVDIDKILSLDDQRRELIQQTQKLREERNVLAKQQVTDQVKERGKQIKEELKKRESELTLKENELNKQLIELPNVPLEHVQPGNEANNKVIRKEGEPKKFNFVPKDHVEIGETLNIIDISRASKVSGSRFAYLKNEGVMLELALVQFAMKKLMREGFTPVVPPALIKKKITEGLGYWQGKIDEKHTSNENYYLVYDPQEEKGVDEESSLLYLVGTGEHAIVPMHSEEILDEKDLPKKYAALSPCFRREAGSYGKDTRGILRVHQFDKLEMVAFVKPEEDEKFRKEMLAIAESFLKDLQLPYQVIQLASGDLSFPAAETIDLETWIPSQNKYRETHSISTTTDFQARRLKIRYKGGPNAPVNFVHILNGTALAIGRILIAILENYQQEDGSVLVPEILQPYTGFNEIKKK